MGADELPANMKARTPAPEGEAWRTVPREPTEEMIEAGETAAWDGPNAMPAIRAMRKAYAAMLAASPVVPVGVSREEIARIIDGIQLTIGDHGPRIRHGERLRATDAILAALRPTDTGWRDIATAPRDGTLFVALSMSRQGELYDSKTFKPFGCWWSEGGDHSGPGWAREVQGWQTYGCHAARPTHWMPLFPAPTDTGRE
jgi:hypothetical protein